MKASKDCDELERVVTSLQQRLATVVNEKEKLQQQLTAVEASNKSLQYQLTVC